MLYQFQIPCLGNRARPCWPQLMSLERRGRFARLWGAFCVVLIAEWEVLSETSPLFDLLLGFGTDAKPLACHYNRFQVS